MNLTPEEDEIEEQRPVRQTIWSTFRHSANWKCLFLSFFIIACLSAITWCRITHIKKKIVNFSVFPITSIKQTSPCEDGVLYLPVAILVMLYLLYLVECFHCPTRIQLRQTLPSSEVSAQIEEMRAAQPVVWWKAVCYHYVRRTRHVTRYRNGDAYTSTQVFYERVNSQAAGACFLYSNCGVKDITRKLVGLSKFPTTKIRFSKGFAFANLEAASEFEEQRARFFQENERRDDYMEMREGLDLTNINFREFVITHRDTKPSPWYTKQSVFWIASLVLLSWPLRFIIEYNTTYVHYQVTKLFGVNYITPISGGRLSRGSTATESRELEINIANNCSLVPSYSEALLMESQSQGIQRSVDANANIQPNGLPSALSSYSVESSRAFINHCSSPRGSRSSSSQMALSGCSLHNGYTIYYPTPLLDRTPADPFQGRDLTTPTEDPPKYEDALMVSAPLLGSLSSPPLRRSFTERNISTVTRLTLPRHSCHYDIETEL
ncbi:UNVERIFIED_CONTAM: hypothetical protein RMT77_013080 [Armadillidium vulgare]